jgi:tripartite-type tricarboxylate transporter receptor subunit TctC
MPQKLESAIARSACSLTPLRRFGSHRSVPKDIMAFDMRVGLPAASLFLRRMTASLYMAFLIFSLTAAATAAETYPSRPIRLLIGFPPGGPADIPARAIAEQLSHSLGVPVVPENKAGAGGMLAMQELLSQPADGHALLTCTYFDPVNTLVYRNARYKVTDIAPVSLIGTYDYVLAVANSVPVEELSGLVAITKASPDRFNYGHIGIASPANLIFKQLEKRTGIKMTAVPFKGSAPAMQELIAGRLDLYIVPPISAVQPFDAGQIKVLATTGKSRLSVMPQVATLQELGVNLISFAFLGICAANGTPAPIIERLNGLVREAVASRQYEHLMDTLGSVPISSSPQELRRVIDNAVREAAPVVEEFNLHMD